MNTTKITDLDKFVLEQVYRPYQKILLGSNTKRMERLDSTYNLNTVMDVIDDNPQWALDVMGRIVRCNFTFPDYVQHPLVSYIKGWGTRGDVS